MFGEYGGHDTARPNRPPPPSDDYIGYRAWEIVEKFGIRRSATGLYRGHEMPITVQDYHKRQCRASHVAHEWQRNPLLSEADIGRI